MGSGIRASLQKEFTDVWCFDLRGNQKTKGEISKKEGGKIFGSGSRTPVSIIILIKNPKKKKCTIHYKDIGDYHTREQKLKMVSDSKSIKGIKDWLIIKSDRHHDWIGQRSEEFNNCVAMGNKDTKSGKNNNAVFKTYSTGVKTNRDAWTYNSSKVVLSDNMKRHIDYCNKQDLDNLKFDPTQAKWTSDLITKLKNSKPPFDKNKIRIALYRPFFKQYMYFDKTYNSAQHQISKFFPKGDSKNIAIVIPDKGKTEIFSAMVTDITLDLHLIEQLQCFPLRIYDDPPPHERECKHIENIVIIISYKFSGKTTAIITNVTPDIQVNYNEQCFPFYYYKEGRRRREHS